MRKVCPGTKLSSKEQVIKMTKILAGMGSSKRGRKWRGMTQLLRLNRGRQHPKCENLGCLLTQDT